MCYKTNDDEEFTTDDDEPLIRVLNRARLNDTLVAESSSESSSSSETSSSETSSSDDNMWGSIYSRELTPESTLSPFMSNYELMKAFVNKIIRDTANVSSNLGADNTPENMPITQDTFYCRVKLLTMLAKLEISCRLYPIFQGQAETDINHLTLDEICAQYSDDFTSVYCLKVFLDTYAHLFDFIY